MGNTQSNNMGNTEVSTASGFVCDSVAPTTVDVGGGALNIAADASVVSGSTTAHDMEHATQTARH